MIIKYHDQIKNEDSYKDDYRLSYDEELKGASTKYRSEPVSVLRKMGSMSWLVVPGTRCLLMATV